MSYLSVDNIIGVQPTTTSSTFLQANIVDVYNGTTNYTHITSASTAAPNNLIIPDANGYFVATTGNQTVQSKMLHSQSGSQADPSYSFLGDVDTGLFRDAANTIGITCGGTKRMSISDTDIIAVLPITATIFKATSGTFPTCAFTNGTNDQTGLYFGTTTTCAIACNGSTKMTFGTTATTSFQPILAQDGSISAPSYSFGSQSNTGMYRYGTNAIGFSANGVESFRVSSSGNFSVNTQGLRTIDGSSSIAGYNFTSEQNSGMFRNAAGDIRFTAGGTVGMGVQANGIFLYGSTAGNNALYSASKLGYYEETGLITGTWTFGGTNTQTGTVYITRIGRFVNLQFTGDVVRTSSGSISQITSDTFIPLRFRPVSARQIGVVMVGDGTSLSFWYANIGGDGSLSFVKILSAAASGSHTIYASSLTWTIS